MTQDWQPTASIATLKKRAQLLADLRAFFAERNLLEVDVPVLSTATVTDPHLQAISARVGNRDCFLQTSPEFYMKRLLAAGIGSCFYLGKAFRQDEQGRRHRPEFTMLEWYRTGFNDRELRAEVLELMRLLTNNAKHRQVSYGDIFAEYLAVDPHRATETELASLAMEHLDLHGFGDEGDGQLDKSSWLDLLFSHCIEPHLNEIVLVYDYPACQCALAKLDQNEQGQTVAKRFELFWNGMELANGYWELSDGREQASRFDSDNKTRQTLGLPEIAPDCRLLAALDAGIPECAGVALGVDRLLMGLTGASAIDEVVPF